jgi:DNA-binding transcriptional LysR family regulator
MDLAFNQLRTFREVAQQGSVTRAARNLGYAQSSVTGHIKSLETKIGHPLLRRLPHGVSLTSHGRIVKEYADKIFQTMDELSGALHPGSEAEGRVMVGADPLQMEQRLGHLVREARYRYPKVLISPRPTSMRAAIEDVARGELALALVTWEPNGPRLPADVVTEKLAPLTLAPVAAPSLASAGQLSEALRPVRVLTVNADCTCHLPLVDALRQQYGIDAPVIEAGSVAGVRELARAGYGLAMLPPDPELAAQHLQIVPTLPHAELDVRLVYARPDHLGRADRSVAELIRRLPAPTPAPAPREAPLAAVSTLAPRAQGRLHLPARAAS